MGGKETGKARPISVWILGHHPLAVQLCERVLTGTAEIRVMHEDIRTLRRRGAEKPSILILDEGSLSIQFPRYLHEVRSAFPEAKFLVTGAKVPNDELCRLLFVGAHGFLPYDDVAERLEEAVLAVADGHLWVPHDVLEEFAKYKHALSELNRRGKDIFTNREKLILGLLERRLSNKEISAAVGISERTVKYFLASIFKKLGVHDRYSAVERARSSPLVVEARLRKRWEGVH